MTKLEEKLAHYQLEMERIGLVYEPALLKAVTKGLGPSIFKTDAETVSGSDARELETVKLNFLIKKHGLNNHPDLDEVIIDTVNTLGKSNRNKYSAIIYYLLVKKFKLESNYNL